MPKLRFDIESVESSILKEAIIGHNDTPIATLISQAVSEQHSEEEPDYRPIGDADPQFIATKVEIDAPEVEPIPEDEQLPNLRHKMAELHREYVSQYIAGYRQHP